jgi:DNA-binding transcriptional LysR family regulator
MNEGTAHLTALLAGVGIGQTLRFMARAGLESGELVELFPDWTVPPVPLHALYPANRYLSAKVRAFIDWVTELFAEVSPRPA